MIHPQGQGSIQHHSDCSVVFYTFIPYDIRSHPYAIFYSRGVHNHLPPPPTKALWDIASELLDVICRNMNPDLTLSESKQIQLVNN